jgi:hypothetical protein
MEFSLDWSKRMEADLLEKAKQTKSEKVTFETHPGTN